MPLTPTTPSADPPEEGAIDDCERVRRILAGAGFDTTSEWGDGLRVWTAPEGVMVGWVAREVLRPTVQVHGHEEDLSRFTLLAGLHKALQTALAVILREAGLEVAPRGNDLVAVWPGTASPTGEEADV
ncbi:hypothetical protein PV721_15160 [Streptomyces sp. MB09-01]|uniref:hypothetical protein n=1 Tax=Streptomyces sp. MB09-01 TaxID=3028666 RepID=UPI0029A662BF|nr:hypothetical protein [Streptomyces sp. MB09-01]MDX3535674.1 hypothetical protein [Streptomyces sp. MB09-01]